MFTLLQIKSNIHTYKFKIALELIVPKRKGLDKLKSNHDSRSVKQAE